MTQARLRELLDYDVATGEFTWRRTHGSRAVIGSIAGSTNTDGYIMVGIDGVRHYAHHLAWLTTYGEWPERHIDHEDENKSNNCIGNLRLSTYSLNGHNQHRARSHNQTGVRGVTTHGPSFRAIITVDGKRHRLGVFPTIETASAAYQQAKRDLIDYG